MSIEDSHSVSRSSSVWRSPQLTLIAATGAAGTIRGGCGSKETHPTLCGSLNGYKATRATEGISSMTDIGPGAAPS